MDLVNAGSDNACNGNVLNRACKYDLILFNRILSHQMLNFDLLVRLGKRESASWKGRKSGSRKMFQVKIHKLILGK